MDDSIAVRVRLLDGFALERGRGDVYTVVEGLPRCAQRLIAHLGLCGRSTRAVVAGELWPDVPEDHAHGSLRSALWRVQKVVPRLVDASGGALELANGVRVDIWEFREWAQWTLDPTTDVGGAMAPQSALAGELLPGWYDDWVLLERERLRQLRLHALEMLAAKLARAGRHGEAVQAACAAVSAEPLRESAHRTLVRVHLAEGNVAEAVRAYRSFRDLLAHDLGVAPSEHMDALMAEVDPALRGPGRAAPH